MGLEDTHGCPCSLAVHSKDGHLFCEGGSRDPYSIHCCHLTTLTVRTGNFVVLDDKNPHIRKTRDDTTIKLDMNSGVHTVDMWICPDEPGPVLAGGDTGRHLCHQ